MSARGDLLHLVVAAALIEALDREVERQRQEKPGQRVTRADVVRSLLWAGLREREIAA